MQPRILIRDTSSGHVFHLFHKTLWTEKKGSWGLGSAKELFTLRRYVSVCSF